jgi:hypothetical protein
MKLRLSAGPDRQKAGQHAALGNLERFGVFKPLSMVQRLAAGRNYTPRREGAETSVEIA